MNLYRINTTHLGFLAYGQLENVDGTHILRVRSTTDQAFAVQADIKAELPVVILAIVNGEHVLPARAHKVMARPEGANAVELSFLLLG